MSEVNTTSPSFYYSALLAHSAAHYAHSAQGALGAVRRRHALHAVRLTHCALRTALCALRFGKLRR